jgi:beta-galactosidase
MKLRTRPPLQKSVELDGDLTYVESTGPSEGTLPPLAMGVTSARSASLNGAWRFHFAHGAVEAAACADPRNAADWPQIVVPGHWALQGWGEPWYTNQYYPFPVAAPSVPDANPTGTYVKDFDWDGSWGPSTVVLRFDGVESTARVWLNGQELGVTRGSRLQQDFDVTPHLRVGVNQLVVRVHQWSGASYLEDQDMWWLAGIFRDVTLLERPAGGIGDVFVHADYDHTDGSGTLRVEAVAGTIVRIAELGLESVAGDSVRIPALQPWSAESPRLYDLEVSTATESQRFRVGFRTVRLVDGLITVNGRPITFRGVNRHEFDPRHGRTLTRAVMEQDLRLMKTHNVNAVRTSHYPPSEEFLALCDEYGLWVMDECDLETHGYVHQQWQGNPSDDPVWREAHLDRMRRTVERDKNHPSIVMWSLGNESHTGANLRAMSEWTRARDDGRLIHYSDDRECEYVDVLGLMYLTVAEVDRIGEKMDRIDESARTDTVADVARRELPFLHTEYAHAMGNGPGGLSDYRDAYERHPRCQGGFVWEWIDHGLAAVHTDGSAYFAYGGDYGEPIHDGPFVLDGLVFPDRTPSAGLLEFKKVFEPVRVEIDSASIRISNLHDFISLDGLEFEWELAVDGEAVSGGRLLPTPVSAGGTVELPLPAMPPTPASALGPGESVLTVRAVTAIDEPWAARGHEIAWAQHVLSAAKADLALAAAIPRRNNAPVRPATGRLTLGPAVFRAETGELLSLGPVEFPTPPRVDLWRAPTSNDIALGQAFSQEAEWRAAGLDILQHDTRSVRHSADAVEVEVRCAPPGHNFGVTALLTWQLGPDAALTLTASITPYGPWSTTWPRAGLRFAVPARHDALAWYGYGPGEGYPDSSHAPRLGAFQASVLDFQTPYVYPQENGSRPGVRRLEILDRDGLGLRIKALSEFGFTARPWTTEELDRARHTYDLVPGPHTVVTLDAALDGLGSASCGPAPLARYRLRPRPFVISATFALAAPLRKGAS